MCVWRKKKHNISPFTNRSVPQTHRVITRLKPVILQQTLEIVWTSKCYRMRTFLYVNVARCCYDFYFRWQKYISIYTVVMISFRFNIFCLYIFLSVSVSLVWWIGATSQALRLLTCQGVSGTIRVCLRGGPKYETFLFGTTEYNTSD